METQHQNDNEFNEWMQRRQEEHRRGKIFGGIVIVGIGMVLLMKKAGFEIPDWLLTWKMLLIFIGFMIGIKHSFRNLGWLIPVAIGGAFLMEGFFPYLTIGQYIWPVVIILFGLALIFKPRNKWHDRWHYKHRRHWERWHGHYASQFTSEESRIDVSSVFGNIKKNVIAKDFSGGEVNCVFAAAEINLSQADINGKAVLEINCVFGGTKLIVPPHWQIMQSELVAVLGGIEDKRPQSSQMSDSTKVLVLKGNVVFGGIEIKSY